MNWTHNEEFNYDFVEGKHCFIHLEKRPPYCDRGNYLAKIFVKDMLQDALQLMTSGRMTNKDFTLEIDDQDGWPRYYFDEGRAKAEIEAWLVKRKEAL